MPKTITLEPEFKPAYLESIEDHDNFFLVRVKGQLGTHALEQGGDKMTAVINRVNLYSKSILCDFSGVTDSDTAMLAALIKRLADFRKTGSNKMVFFNIRGELRELFEIAHLAKLFLICQTREEAEAALSAV